MKPRGQARSWNGEGGTSCRIFGGVGDFARRRADMRITLWQSRVFGACVLLAAPMAGQGQEKAAGKTNRHVQQERLWENLQKLGEFGKNPEGGVSRVGFTDVDL